MKHPPEAWERACAAAQTIVKPLKRFLHVQAASGILLLIAAVAAMIWANSPWQHSYHHLWHAPITLGFADFTFRTDLHFLINDGLMVLFFFVVGLEIRRELHEGELADFKRASLPIAAAVGGMAVPALVFLALNYSEPDALRGWGVPMATDIAFAVGVLALLGKRVSASLRVLLLALAIIDDVGAILVIALFYSTGVAFSGLAIAALGVLAIMIMQRLGIRSPLVYVPPGVVIWAGMLTAGIHPTIAGVVIGLLTPVRPWFGGRGFVKEANRSLETFRQQLRPEVDQHELARSLDRLDQARREAFSPVVRLEVAMHPWVCFFIMPIFAFANAGVTLGEVNIVSGSGVSLGAGIILGLALGKPIGIVGASFLVSALGLAQFPRGVDWRGLLVVGAVGGIGFTMSIFIADLAFSNPELLGVAKLSVLVASLLAGTFGFVAGLLLLPKKHPRKTDVNGVGKSHSHAPHRALQDAV